MELDTLGLFVEIIDAGNLSQAARRLGISRANVSYHLQRLEQSLNVQLVRRTTRRVEATEAGLALYQHARSIRNEWRQAQESLSAIGKELKGRIRLSVPNGYGHLVMMPWLIEFKRRYPGIVLELAFENEVLDLLREEIDVAVKVMAEPPPELVARRLGSVRYVICAQRGYAQRHGLPQRPEQLDGLPMIVSPLVLRHLQAAQRKGGGRHEMAMHPVLVVSHYPFMREAILAGLGVALAPDYVVREDIDAGNVVTALDDWPVVPVDMGIYMLYMPDRHRTQTIRALIDFIIGKFTGDP